MGGCQTVKFNQMQVKRRTAEIEKRAHETVFLRISSTHQMANIILDDSHFAKESEKKGLVYLILWTIGGKLQSSVTYLEYLTHSERHYFFLQYQ